jgi:proliferating cell nuclear antigen PCNA
VNINKIDYNIKSIIIINTMKLQLNNKERITQFNVLFQNLKAFSEHVILNASKNGIFMQGMDSSQSSCFEAKLNAAWFDSYEYNLEDETTSFGVSTQIIQKILGIYEEKQEIEISIDENIDNLFVSFTGSNVGFDKFFEIPLMDIDQDMLEITSEESEIDIIMESKQLCELVSQLQIFHDKLVLTFTESQVLFLASGADGTMKVNINLDDFIEYAIQEDYELEQAYNLRHVSMMCLFGKLNKHCNMAFHQNRPMETRFKLEEDSYVVFYLAPKIDV